MTGTIMEMKPAAVSRWNASPRVPTREASPTVRGATSELVPRKTRDTRRSFHTHRNWKMAKEARAGYERGRTRRVNAVKGVAPSIYADSKMSLGS